jgi:Cys-tRNA(Pro)/Cys-tRNA(Cys) deacylase
MSTRAIQLLRKQKIPHEVVTYDHQVKGALFAAQATNFPPGRTIKTIVVETGDAEYCLALAPGDRQVSFKKLARVLSRKKVAMASEKDAEKITGYLIGGISPFGTRKAVPVVMEEDLLPYDQVLINAGQRGTMLKMDPADIARALNCTTASITDPESG